MHSCRTGVPGGGQKCVVTMFPIKAGSGVVDFNLTGRVPCRRLDNPIGLDP